MTTVVEPAVEYIVRVAIVTFGQLFILFGVGIILVSALSLLSFYVAHLAVSSMGEGLYLRLFGWLGTAIHETGHAIFGMIFGHTIREYRPFKPDRATNSLGYVRAGLSYNSLYQVIGMFFFGIGPVLFGTLIIYISLLILLAPDMFELLQSVDMRAGSIGTLDAFTETILPAAAAILVFLFRPEHLADWRFYLFVYIAFAVGSSVRLSRSDISAATAGFIALVIFLFLFNLATLGLGGLSDAPFVFVSQLCAFFYAIMVFVILLNLIAGLMLLPFALLRGLR